MAIVRIPHLSRTLIMPAEIELYLRRVGVEYRRWAHVLTLPQDAPVEEVLTAYGPQLELYRHANDFAGYDVLELSPKGRSAEAVRGEFKREHWHNDSESYFILAGRGICYIHPASQPAVSVELEPGDLISIRPYVRHWCDVCPETCFRAVRFLSHAKRQNTVYTSSGIEAEYEPLYISPASFAHADARLK